MSLLIKYLILNVAYLIINSDSGVISFVIWNHLSVLEYHIKKYVYRFKIYMCDEVIFNLLFEAVDHKALDFSWIHTKWSIKTSH